MTFPNARDCEHGNQRGKCVHCDLAEVEELNKSLHIKIEAQQARIAELKSVLKRCYMIDLHDNALLTDVATAVARTDDLTSLAAHDAAVKKAALLAIQKLIIDAGCTTALEWIGRVLKVLEEEEEQPK